MVRVWKRTQYLGTKKEPYPLRRGETGVLFAEPWEIWEGLKGGRSGKDSSGGPVADAPSIFTVLSAIISSISNSRMFCSSRRSSLRSLRITRRCCLANRVVLVL